VALPANGYVISQSGIYTVSLTAIEGQGSKVCLAFSDGSLLHGFAQRIAKGQPLSAPRDVRRYFITQEESGVLCVMSCLLGESRDIFFPKLDPAENLLTFSEIAVRYLESLGFARETEPDGLDLGIVCFSEPTDPEGFRRDLYYTMGDSDLF